MALVVALICFVLSQAAWTVPLHAMTHCGQPPRPDEMQMQHHHAMDAMADDTSETMHECCPPSGMTADCTHPAQLEMAQCATSQTCCRIEQERRVPKSTSTVGLDRSDSVQQPHLIGTSDGQQRRIPSAANTPAHPRPVLDQKSDLRI